MDIRVINTKNRILNGLIHLISEKSLDACTTMDIVEKSEISKRTFYNYYKNKQDLVKQIETELLHGLEQALAKDRSKLVELYQKQDIAQMASSAFDETLRYCEQHRSELAALLSSNGDITFFRCLVKLANDELDQRMPFLFKGKIALDSECDKVTFSFFRTSYVDVIIDLFIFWLNNKEFISTRYIKRLAGLVQTNSPAQMIQKFLNNKKGTHPDDDEY